MTDRAEPGTVMENESGSGRTIVVGLVADPGLSIEVVERLAGELPEELASEVDGEASWDIRLTAESAPLDANGDIPLVEYAQAKMPAEGWDLMVVITDLARYDGIQPVPCEVAAGCRAAQLSLPALGSVRLRRHVRAALVYLIRELTDPDTGRADDEERSLSHRMPGVFPPVRCRASTRDGFDTYLVGGGRRSQARLLAGMVRMNRPWRLVSGLSRALAAAAAAAAFGIFFSNVWSLADAINAARLTLVTVLAVAAMTIWLIFYNDLWEDSSRRPTRSQTALHNTATAATVTVGVMCVYALLFVLILIGSLAVISPTYLASTLGHPAGWSDYIDLAWLSTSMGTFAGALGAGLETETAVRRATYSRRELERQARHRQDQQAAQAAQSHPDEE